MSLRVVAAGNESWAVQGSILRVHSADELVGTHFRRL